MLPLNSFLHNCFHNLSSFTRMTRHLQLLQARAVNLLPVLKLLLVSSYRKDKKLFNTSQIIHVGIRSLFTTVLEKGRGAVKQWIPGMLWKALIEHNLYGIPRIKWEMESQHSIHDWRVVGTKRHDIMKDRRKWVNPVEKSQQEGWEKQYLKRWVLL